MSRGDHSPAPAFVHLAEVGDPAAARVLAARLEAEGIEVRMQGEWLGPYPVTVGSMARTRLLVPPDHLEEARLVLTAAEVDDALAGATVHGEEVRPESTHPAWVFTALLLLGIAIVWALRYGRLLS